MATDALNSAKATSNLTESKIAHKITQESQKLLHKNNSETNEEKMLGEKYISPELRQKFIDDLRLKEETF